MRKLFAAMFVLALGSCTPASEEDADSATSDIHGSRSPNPTLAVEFGAAEDTRGEDEYKSQLPGPTTIKVDIIDIVGTPKTSTAWPGAAARTESGAKLILAFNRYAPSSPAAPLPTLVVNGQFEVTDGPVARNIFSNILFVEAVRAQMDPNRLTVVLISPATMTLVRTADTCAFTTSALRNAIFLSFANTCLNDQTMLVHEMGHWLGLEHTYGDDNTRTGATKCVVDGKMLPHMDYVEDTPVHLGTGEDFSCGGQLPDSCPDQPGLDPFYNIMSMGCEREFTPGQLARMSRTWARVWQSRGFKL